MTGQQAACGVVGAVLSVALAGCGPRAAGPSAERDSQTRARTPAQASAPAYDATTLPPAGRIALAYTLAARSWTPSDYLAHYIFRMRLSTGALRRSLKQTPPTREQVAAYRADHARLASTALAVDSLLLARTQARYRIMVDERSIAAGQTVRARAAYSVELQRRGGRWYVAGFSVEP